MIPLKIIKIHAVLKQIINQDSSDASKKDSTPSETSGGNKNQNQSQPSPSPTGNPKMSSSKNILSSDVEIKGTLKFANDLIIDGKIEGEINSDGDLTVGENAAVHADIRTRSVTVFGKVRGNILVSDRCELKQNAELHGDVTAGKLAIEEGATFMGASTVGAAAKKAAMGSSQSSPNASPPAARGDESGSSKQPAEAGAH